MRGPRHPALLPGGESDLDREVGPALDSGGVIGPLPDEQGRRRRDKPGEEPVAWLDGPAPGGTGDLQ